MIISSREMKVFVQQSEHCIAYYNGKMWIPRSQDSIGSPDLLFLSCGINWDSTGSCALEICFSPLIFDLYSSLDCINNARVNSRKTSSHYQQEGPIRIMSEFFIVSKRNIHLPANDNAFHGIC
jgi:hypothetical protein